MECQNINECFEQIKIYSSHNKRGYPLLINVENFDDFQDIVHRLEFDGTKRCIYVSENSMPNGLPNIKSIFSTITQEGSFVLIGASQACRLQSKQNIELFIDEILSATYHGNAIILLEHCNLYLSSKIQRDIRCKRNIVLVSGITSSFPNIKLVKNEEECIEGALFRSISELIHFFEISNEKAISENRVLNVLTSLGAKTFYASQYTIYESEGMFSALKHKYPEFIYLKKEFGSENQWIWLGKKLTPYHQFSDFIKEYYGNTDRIIDELNEAIQKRGNELWLLWISLHMSEVKNNQYLKLVISKSKSSEVFEQEIYNEILNVDFHDSQFKKLFFERKKILQSLHLNVTCITEYCDMAGKFKENAIYYLTSLSQREQFDFLNYLSMFEYKQDDLMGVIKDNFPQIYSYMTDFTFDQYNTNVPISSADFLCFLTEYFKQYKFQKLTNKLLPSFVDTVNQEATKRTFMILQPRISIFNKINEKEKTLFYFFDALGVEFLSYIVSICEKENLIVDYSIGRCELPSITSMNKEFEPYCPNIKKISELDEVKHDGQTFNYMKCKTPIHLFRELEIIHEAIINIKNELSISDSSKAVIVSDHGASRLAVVYGKEFNPKIELAEKANHSGRCCKINKDPDLPQACYENNFAVLANYERFKGSRAADVEVHGGASLEEVLVPVITISLKPTDLFYSFINDVIIFKIKQPVKLTLYSNNIMKVPRLKVNETYYDGTLLNDKKYAEFVIPDLKRSGEYCASIYEGKTKVQELTFTLNRNTKTNDDFDL